MADPVSSIWPKPLADFLTHDGPGLGIKRVAMLYATNDFTGTQANAVRKFIKESNSGVELVFDEGVPTETSNYTVLLNNIRAANPDAVFISATRRTTSPSCATLQDSGIKFKFLFASIRESKPSCWKRTSAIRRSTMCSLTFRPSDIAYENEFGMSLKDYSAAWHKKYADSKVEFGFNSVAGYTTGLVLEKTLATAESLDQLELRKAIFALSGNLKTLDGTFELDPTGAQIGEITPLGQFIPATTIIRSW
jgi:branched-chain amino acid transport system substrate-binding protein